MIPHRDSVSAELREVEIAHPGWHAFASRDGEITGRVYAAIPVSDLGGSGTTLDAATPELLDHEIAVWEYEHRGVAA